MKNPYKPQSLRWKLVEGDWEDLTPAQIGEVLGYAQGTVRKALWEIGADGIQVPHADGRKSRYELQEGDF